MEDQTGNPRFIQGEDKPLCNCPIMLPNRVISCSTIGIKHDFPCINIRKVPREVLKTKGEAQGFQHLLRDLANVNEWQNHVWSLLLHKSKENTPKIEKMVAHFILQPTLPPFSYAHMLFITILDLGCGQVLFLMMIWRLSTCFAWRPGACINIIQ